MFHDKNWEFINDPTSIEFRELEGAASYHYFKQKVFENYYKNILSEAKRLIEQIDKSYKIN